MRCSDLKKKKKSGLAEEEFIWGLVHECLAAFQARCFPTTPGSLANSKQTICGIAQMQKSKEARI